MLLKEQKNNFGSLKNIKNDVPALWQKAGHKAVHMIQLELNYFNPFANKYRSYILIIF